MVGSVFYEFHVIVNLYPAWVDVLHVFFADAERAAYARWASGFAYVAFNAFSKQRIVFYILRAGCGAHKKWQANDDNDVFHNFAFIWVIACDYKFSVFSISYIYLCVHNFFDAGFILFYSFFIKEI